LIVRVLLQLISGFVDNSVDQSLGHARLTVTVPGLDWAQGQSRSEVGFWTRDLQSVPMVGEADRGNELAFFPVN
jgi:hypothetical protein